jgi:hypothetical protein
MNDQNNKFQTECILVCIQGFRNDDGMGVFHDEAGNGNLKSNIIVFKRVF